MHKKQHFIKEIAKEKDKMPIVLSIIKPYSEQFVTTSDHLPPQLLSSIYDLANLVKSYTQLIELIVDFTHLCFTMEDKSQDKVA